MSELPKSSESMTAGEIAAAMRHQGIGEAAIEKYIAYHHGPIEKLDIEIVYAPETTGWYPIQMTLPWSSLCSDNYRYKASMVRVKGGETKPRMVHDQRYAASLDAIEHVARRAMAGRHAIAAPLNLESAVYVPDRRPHDFVNFAKVVHDALEKIVYVNDRWLHDVHWWLAGVDVDAPRAEIKIFRCLTSPLEPPGPEND